MKIYLENLSKIYLYLITVKLLSYTTGEFKHLIEGVI